MNSHLFPHIGKVIASTGSRHFPRMLHDLILTQLAVDATHITQMPVSSPRKAGSSRMTGISPVYTDPLPGQAEAQAAAQLHLTRRKDDVSYVLVQAFANGPMNGSNFLRCRAQREKPDLFRPGY